MLRIQQATIRNRLLAALSPADFGLLQPHLEPFELLVRKTLFRPQQPIDYVTFPEAGLLSLTVSTPQGHKVEIGMIGREGLSGLPVVLSADRSPFECFVQASGEALRLPAGALRQAIEHSRSLHDVLLRYSHAFSIQTAQTAFVNARFALEARLARWLLMSHDRTDGDDLPLTHEFLSMMLGVRRAGVTTTLGVFTDEGVIGSERGQIRVLDRAKLEEVAGRSYGLPEAEYARLMGLRQ